ncbi:ISKra4 family transposase [Lusitaniella coriacea]|uniref:ISKra4 family transposase n=1 Tax=Lusitaniella coriacea TaxID=1983105 RepID=UPI003CF71515
MTPEETKELDNALETVAAILFKHTPPEQLQDFESLERSVRDHLLEQVSPRVGNFFKSNAIGTLSGRKRKVQSCLGVLRVSQKQAVKLGLKDRTRLSPLLEKSCLLLSANVSYENAARDLQVLTGISVSHSTQQRLVQRTQWSEVQASEVVETLSVDGGKVRLRTPIGQESQWRDYKAVTLHGRLCGAWLQDNEALLKWVNQQPLAAGVNCLGDGHDGVWNLISGITPPEHRRETLDWYHLAENLYKVGGSLQRLKQVESDLWRGRIDQVKLAFVGWNTPQVKNFLGYLHKHRHRIPDYQSYQQQGICIGSGAVESTIKQIGRRLKLSGAQWKQKNVAQVLKQRCAYLNFAIA